MKILDDIIKKLLKKYIEGQDYFTALDKSIQYKIIADKLFSIITANNIIIVSGGYGNFIKKNYPEKNLLTLEGGLRHFNAINLEHIVEKIRKKDFIFIDDSYYLGRTRNVIRAEIERLGGNFKHAYVIYDGSKYKDKEITSLFRYHDRF